MPERSVSAHRVSNKVARRVMRRDTQQAYGGFSPGGTSKAVVSALRHAAKPRADLAFRRCGRRGRTYARLETSRRVLAPPGRLDRVGSSGRASRSSTAHGWAVSTGAAIVCVVDTPH